VCVLPAWSQGCVPWGWLVRYIYSLYVVWLTLTH